MWRRRRRRRRRRGESSAMTRITRRNLSLPRTGLEGFAGEPALAPVAAVSDARKALLATLVWMARRRVLG